MNHSHVESSRPDAEAQQPRHDPTVLEIEEPKRSDTYDQQAKTQLQHELDGHVDVMNHLMLQLRRYQMDRSRKQQQIESLQVCVDGLKMGISTMSDRKDELADNIIADKFQEMYHGIQNFALSHYHGATFDIQKVGDDGQKTMLRFAPGAQDGHHPDLLAMSVMSQSLTSAMDASNSFGSSTTGPAGAAWFLSAKFKDRRDVRTRRWITDTTDLLERHCKDDVQRSDDALVRNVCEGIRHTLFLATEVHLDTKAKTKLSKIVKSAVHLWMSLHRQEREYVVEMVPAMGSAGPQHFHPESMADIAGTGAAELEGMNLSMSVFPMIYKCQGPNEDDEGVVIFQAKVLVEQEATSYDSSSEGSYRRAQSESIV